MKPAMSGQSAQRKRQFKSKVNQNTTQRGTGWCFQGEKKEHVTHTQKKDEDLQLGAVELAMRPLCTFLHLRIVTQATVTPARPLM